MRKGTSDELTKQDLLYLTYVKRTLADATGLPLDKFTCGMTKTGYIVTIEAEELDELVAENWESMKDEDYEKAHPDEDDETLENIEATQRQDREADEREQTEDDRRQMFSERLSRVGAYAL